MDLEETPLWPEVQKIIFGGPKPIAYYWKAQLHYKDVTIDINKVVSIDNVRNYEGNFGDEMVLETGIPMGIYAKHIYPNRNILEITLYKEPLEEVGDGIKGKPFKQDLEKLKEFREAERFKAVPIIDGLPVFEANDYDKQNKMTLDLSSFMNISFQVFNSSLEKLRLVTVGGVWRRVIHDEVLKSVLKIESLKVKTRENPPIIAVDIVPPDNNEVREHTLIPQGTKLLAVPTHLHEKCNGVYNAGLGSYLQKSPKLLKQTWWVYPLFNTKRFYEETRRTAVLFKVPEKRLVAVERTFRIEGKTIFIIGTSTATFKDDANTEFMNKGNGFRLADARQFMGKEVVAVDNKAIISRKKLNHELITLGKDDNVNNTQVSYDEISANPFLDYARLVSRDGGIVEFVWENSNPKYLIPGMMIKMYYMDNDKVKKIYGVLLYNHVLVQLNGVGITITQHITTCHLGIFVTKAKN